ncbi:family 16 glycosylhydrolase [Frankia sp. AvcI1]|uniref:glycoside hydrolase family 16 protein n=1 Tax=Frankia sp. AvcI1 TaxID=573496 RepID=UPI002118C3A0|nr:glycoside hydrolase family 16 protein [Frankia sp. AvcI1]
MGTRLARTMTALLGALALLIAIGGPASSGAGATVGLQADTVTCTTDTAGYCTVRTGLLQQPAAVRVETALPALHAVDRVTPASFRVRFLGVTGNPQASTPVRFAYTAVLGRPETPLGPPGSPTVSPSPTTSPPAGPTGPVGQTGAWTLPFADDFTGTALDLSRWVLCNPSFASSCQPYNREQETYNTAPTGNGNVSVSGGQLHLTATQSGGKIYSGMVSTGPDVFGANNPGYHPFQFTYGYYEGRVRVPSGNGFWPSLWMLPDQRVYGGWPDSGEEDVFEIAGNDPTTVHLTEHDAVSGQAGDTATATITGPDTAADFHVYGFDWEPDHLSWYIDGHRARLSICTEIYAANHPGECNGYHDPAAFKAYPFYLIANLSVGGNWPPLHGGPDSTTRFPASMDLDYLRVWQRV